MGILDGVVSWIAEKVMACLDLMTSSVSGALGCNMDIFIRYFRLLKLFGCFMRNSLDIEVFHWR